MTKAATLESRWRFTAMSNWHNDYIDLVEPGFTFAGDSGSEMVFGVVTAALDCAFDETRPDVSFTFVGSDEGDQVSGQGSAELTGPDTVTGETEFHNGDDTTFQARRW